MPIRAQCDNCGRVYNLPDESAGKRLRCKQCAVAFTVPNLAPEPATIGPQKICVVCGQNVAGRPRTKDQAGNYYCRPCYEEKARNREQLAQSRVGAAVPAGVGAGGGEGGDDGEMIDLAALEPEQFDDSTQPPPPPIPDMDLVAPPIPDMEEPIMAEPVIVELPKPKKKKKKKKGAAAKAASADSFMGKMGALPIELWIVGVGAILFAMGLMSSSMAGPAITGLWIAGLGCLLWGEICIVMVAFAEGTITGLMYLFLPIYPLVFIITHWSDVGRHFGRAMLGVLFFICSIVITGKTVADHVVGALKDQEEKRQQDFSTDPSYVIHVELERPPTDEATMQKNIAGAILESFKQRNVKPAQGKYTVTASVAPGLDTKHKVTISINGQQMKMPSPKLVCTLEVMDSSENVLYQQSRDSLPDPAMLQVSDDSNKSGDDFQKELWKNVITEFKTLAQEVPAAAGAAAPAGSAAPADDKSK